MANVLQAVVRLPSLAGDPVDTVHNDFVFGAPDVVDATVIGHLTDALEHFYTSVPAGGVKSISQYLSHTLDGGNSAIDFYDITPFLAGGAKGSPTFSAIGPFGVSGSGVNVDLPMGLAIAMSYRSTYGAAVEFGHPTRPRARHRGRIYLGPLNSDSIGDTTVSPFRSSVKSQCRSDIALAGKALQLEVEAFGADYHWMQWSRVDATVRRVESVTVDDRFDYQRRREDQGLVRTTVPF